ncbi:MAG TPA: hypothetical protein VFW19_12620 [Allosphingosinicella sp.]|nr:hypothetical protein [Allosphingosinicella sp.]
MDRRRGAAVIAACAGAISASTAMNGTHPGSDGGDFLHGLGIGLAIAMIVLALVLIARGRRGCDYL